MVYLDYSATTPVDSEVIRTFSKACEDYWANPNSLHKLGVESKKLIDFEIDEENPSVAHFHERWHRNEPLFGRIVTPSFSNLVTNKGKENESLIAEGTWEITFTIRYPDTSEKIPVRNLDVYDENGKRYRVKEIILSYMGVHMEVVEYDPVFTEVSYISFQTALLLKDGTEVPLEGGGGGRMTEGDKTRKFSYYGEFDIPIPREDIQAIVICGTTYELNNAN